MTPKQLYQAAQLLFPGKSWKTDLGNTMGVSRFTVNRWMKKVPPIVYRGIEKMLSDRIKKINEWQQGNIK